LWGAATGNKALRDAGIFLYTNTLEAIEQYWFDIDRAVFPKGFDYPCVGMVWSSGGKFDTWWDSNPTFIHGINYIPFQGGSLYLGRHPALVKRQYDALIDRLHGKVFTWRDYVLMYQALAEGTRASKSFDDDTYLEPEFGDSRAMLYTWVRALAQLGQVDASVTADVATYAVLRKKNTRGYVAFNPGDETKLVTFSDGYTLEVPPRKLVEGERAVSEAKDSEAKGSEAKTSAAK
jgi:hypothetical protein